MVVCTQAFDHACRYHFAGGLSVRTLVLVPDQAALVFRGQWDPFQGMSPPLHPYASHKWDVLSAVCTVIPVQQWKTNDLLLTLVYFVILATV